MSSSFTETYLTISSLRIGIGIPIPTVMVAPYPRKLVPLSHSGFICFRSPTTAIVPEPPRGTPFSPLAPHGLCWVPFQDTYPIPPPRNILVPIPIVL